MLADIWKESNIWECVWFLALGTIQWRFWQPALKVRLMAFLVIDCLLLVLFNNVFGNSVAISGKCVSYISNEVALAWWYVSWNVGTFKQFGSHLGESDIWNFVLDGMFKILLAGKREIDWWFLLRSRIWLHGDGIKCLVVGVCIFWI